MKVIFLLIHMSLSFSLFAAPKVRDLSVEKLARGMCGTIASALTERVYNTNKEMGKEYYLTPVFKSDVDFEMMRYLKLLVSDSEKFTAKTPDSERLSNMFKAFDILSRRNFRYAKECLKIYRPVAKKCYSTYESDSKEEADNCMRRLVDSKEETAFIKKFFLRPKS